MWIMGTTDPVSDEFEAVRKKLETIFTSAKRKLGIAFDTIKAVIDLARACGVNRKILIRPTLSRNAEVNCHQ